MLFKLYEELEIASSTPDALLTVHVAPGTFEWSTSRNGTGPHDGFISFLILMPSHPPVCFIQYSRTFVHAFPSLSLATNFHISLYHERLSFSRGFKIQLCISSSEFSMLAYFPSTYLRFACENTASRTKVSTFTSSRVFLLP